MFLLNNKLNQMEKYNEKTFITFKFFPMFSFPLQRSGRTGISWLCIFFYCDSNMCARPKSDYHHEMLCTLEIKSIGGFTQACGISKNTENILSPLSQWLWQPNSTGWWFTMRGYHKWSHMTISSRGLRKSCDKLKTYLHYYNPYGHQTWDNGDLIFSFRLRV